MSGHVRPTEARDVRIPATVVSERCERELHVLLWQVRGSTDLVVGGDERTLTAGHAVWIPVATQHSFVVREGSVTMPVFFDAATTRTTLDRPTTITVDRGLRTALLACNVAQTTVVGSRGDLERQLVSMIESRPTPPSTLPMPTDEPALTIARMLRKDPGDVRGVDELAATAHATTRTIQRSFRAQTGMTLRRWRIENRMASAALFLRTQAGVTAVARRVGYSNVNSFRRAFTAHVGLTPTEYARRYARE